MRSLFNDMGVQREKRKTERKKSELSFDSEGRRELKKTRRRRRRRRIKAVVPAGPAKVILPCYGHIKDHKTP